MFQSVRFLSQKEMVAIVGITVFLTGFVGFLLVSNSHSLQKLQDSPLSQFVNRHQIDGRRVYQLLVIRVNLFLHAPYRCIFPTGIHTSA